MTILWVRLGIRTQEKDKEQSTALHPATCSHTELTPFVAQKGRLALHVDTCQEGIAHTYISATLATFLSPSDNPTS